MKIHLYGRLADGLGREIDVDAPSDCSIADLRTRLAAEHPDAAQMLMSMRSRACVDDVLVGEDHRPATGEQVEFLPPVSGG